MNLFFRRRAHSSAVRLNIRGAEILMDPISGNDLVVTKASTDSFERPLPEILVETVRNLGDGIFLDVGANSGVYSLLACAANESVVAYAYEPFQLAIDAMKKNLEANRRLTRRITIRPIALSESSGEQMLYVPPPTGSLLETSVSLERDFKPGSVGTPIRSARLDDELLPGKVTVAKVDIEGHEHSFLRGAAGTIAADRPLIFLEILRTPHIEEIREFFAPLDYANYELIQTGSVKAVANIDFNIVAWNHALVPRELVGVFEKAVHQAGCPLS